MRLYHLCSTHEKMIRLRGGGREEATEGPDEAVTVMPRVASLAI